ncbi:hypothetical protein AGRA3207_007614 [Actinomadura graeca]|uniref:Protein kinase domain-containing protein n=1 Tax=Actinomadura graeca TaxID=2750812 RepID=A0ABX8R5A8_9ACTN|nr:hypothetical protein [Actinomadura graeca]QXJ26028.1 hypothetical protein AGRA3207_007614 [Actinomadura graeca]
MREKGPLPEQALGDPATPRSDGFSLGASLVFAATGAAPFGIGHKVRGRIVHGEPDLSRCRTPCVGLVTTCLVKDPADRPSPDQVLIALSTLIGVQERTLVEITAELPTVQEETR